MSNVAKIDANVAISMVKFDMSYASVAKPSESFARAYEKFAKP